MAEEVLKFKTNINCGGCIARVTPFMNKQEGMVQWSVDTENPEKILTVISNGISQEQVMQTIRKVGFTIEQV